MIRVALIDYGAGNLTSVVKGLKAVGADVVVASTPTQLDATHALVVPGVGHFGRTSALDGPWRDAVGRRLEAGTPLLGICLGMQWLFEASDEAPSLPGLGIFPGICRRLPAGVKVPHVGWNQVQPTLASSRLLDGVQEPWYAYFAHSFAAPAGPGAVAVTEHGARFASIVERGNVFGAQCHPEKSGAGGLRLLARFVTLASAEANAAGARC